MPTRDWSALGFTPTLNFALPNERQLAQSSLADAGKGAEFKFNPTAMNQQLLASLGYTGQGLTTMPASDYGFDPSPVWSDEARTWLANNGYTVGVAHDPGSSPGGRPEYYGLVDANGQFVAGQDEPTMTMSDTTFDQIAPFALMAAPFAAQAMFGGGLAGGTAGSLAAADTGLTALGSAWSPSALGITAVTPAATAAEIAALGSGIPGAVGAAGAGAAGAGISTLGGGGSSVTALGSGMSPAALGITPVAPSFSAAEIAALGSGIPGLPASSLVPDLPNLPDVPDYTPQSIPDIPDRTFPNIPDVPGLTPQTNWLQDLVKPIGSAIKPISDAVGGGSNLAALVGAGVGAATGGGSTTSSRDPWGPSQDFLKAVLGDAGSALTNLRQNPYTPQQTAAYSNAFAGLDQARSALPGLLGWGQSAMQRQSTTPSYAQLFGGGLLQQPTAQAGGGLVGEDDRMKALMARGRGLIG